LFLGASLVSIPKRDLAINDDLLLQPILKILFYNLANYNNQK
jgi:hypothetical protein